MKSHQDAFGEKPTAVRSREKSSREAGDEVTSGCIWRETNSSKVKGEAVCGLS